MPIELRDHPEAIIELSRRDLEDIVAGAAKRGAQEALMAVGLAEPNAVHDVKELRSLLAAWRDMRATALRTMVQVITGAFLAALVVGIAIKLGVLGEAASHK